MFENKTEAQARQEILDLVAEYCEAFHNKKKPFEEGIGFPTPPGSTTAVRW